jgi:hypothetical protein
MEIIMFDFKNKKFIGAETKDGYTTYIFEDENGYPVQVSELYLREQERVQDSIAIGYQTEHEPFMSENGHFHIPLSQAATQFFEEDPEQFKEILRDAMEKAFKKLL